MIHHTEWASDGSAVNSRLGRDESSSEHFRKSCRPETAAPLPWPHGRMELSLLTACLPSAGASMEIDAPRMAMLHLSSQVSGDRGLWHTNLAALRRGAHALQEAAMFGRKPEAQETTPTQGPSAPPVTLLTVIGDSAKLEGKFQIADSIQIDCEVGGDLRVGRKLIISEKGVVNANVETVDAIILGHYEGNMTATGNVEIAATGRVRGNLKTDSLVISKGGYFGGNVAKINDEPRQAVHEPDGHGVVDERRDRGDARRLLDRPNEFIVESQAHPDGGRSSPERVYP